VKINKTFYNKAEIVALGRNREQIYQSQNNTMLQARREYQGDYPYNSKNFTHESTARGVHQDTTISGTPLRETLFPRLKVQP
jgi:hypothetical protein